MPTIPYIIPFDDFEDVATAGKWYDELHRLEKIKKSFNQVHDYVRRSMNLNFKFLDGVIEGISHAVQELEALEDEADHACVIQTLFDSIREGFQPFNTSYYNAEFQLRRRITTLKKALYPYQANSYEHSINDGNKDELNEMIVMHLYRQGLFDIGDELISEAKSGLLLDKMTDARSKFMDLHAILDAVRKCQIELPLQWISDNRERLGEVTASDLEFKVHVIKYTSMVEDANKMEDGSARNEAILEALNYAKAFVTCFPSKNDVHEIEKLISCVLHMSDRVKLIGHSRYYHFFNGTYMRNLIEDIEKQFCIMMGQCGTSPLRTLTSVGEIAVSGVCKAASIVGKDKGRKWGNLAEIPLELSLSDKFKFHSQFACPLSKNLMQNGLNPPIALSCGHVFSLQQLIQLMMIIPSVRIVRCPYCLAYTLHEHCKTVYF